MRNLIICLVFFACSCSCSSSSEEVIKNNDNNVIIGDDNSNNEPEPDTSLWSIPVNEVYDGGPGKDGIPSIDSPVFIYASDSKVANYMNDEDLIVGVKRSGEIKAYPFKILDWHEIVNDDLSGEKISISYCPLTGTAFAWESKVSNEFTEFGVSGLLYNTNLILYDRKSDSYWSQLKLECVNGEFINEKPKIVNLVETTWGEWKKLYPNSKILSNEQGFIRNYNNYPYGRYKEDHSFFLFPVVYFDDSIVSSIESKQRVHAVLGEKNAKVFKFETFGNGKAVKTSFLTDKLLVVGDENKMHSYVLNSDQENLVFEYDFDNSNSYFKDNEGNKWNVFGEAVEGVRKGEVLKPTVSLMSYWFAIPAFYKGVEIY